MSTDILADLVSQSRYKDDDFVCKVVRDCLNLILAAHCTQNVLSTFLRPNWENGIRIWQFTPSGSELFKKINGYKIGE